jgi:hypothetical protein
MVSMGVCCLWGAQFLAEGIRAVLQGNAGQRRDALYVFSSIKTGGCDAFAGCAGYFFKTYRDIDNKYIFTAHARTPPHISI